MWLVLVRGPSRSRQCANAGVTNDVEWAPAWHGMLHLSPVPIEVAEGRYAVQNPKPTISQEELKLTATDLQGFHGTNEWCSGSIAIPDDDARTRSVSGVLAYPRTMLIRGLARSHSPPVW